MKKHLNSIWEIEFYSKKLRPEQQTHLKIQLKCKQKTHTGRQEGSREPFGASLFAMSTQTGRQRLIPNISSQTELGSLRKIVGINTCVLELLHLACGNSKHALRAFWAKGVLWHGGSGTAVFRKTNFRRWALAFPVAGFPAVLRVFEL